jgi:hypothetical protein
MPERLSNMLHTYFVLDNVKSTDIVQSLNERCFAQVIFVRTAVLLTSKANILSRMFLRLTFRSRPPLPRHPCPRRNLLLLELSMLKTRESTVWGLSIAHLPIPKCASR